MPDLKGKVAVITGASRGAGRGIALVLGESGATVYVTGRTLRGQPAPDNLPGSIDDTAAEVTARGGTGIAVRCDHTVDTDVETLFARVRREQGRLDLLVNNAWGGYEDDRPSFGPFWEQPPARVWQKMFVAGLWPHLLASRFAVPLMLPESALVRKQPIGVCPRCCLAVFADEPHTELHMGFVRHQRDCVGGLEQVQPRGLIVNTVAWAYGRYLGLFYDVAKASVIRMAFGLAQELRPHGIAAVALAPGFMRSERVMAAHAQHPFDLTGTESTEYIGRAVAALAADPQVLRKSGNIFTVGDLARDYGFTDVDGQQPEAFRFPESS
jgi:NAD(P)-dependent dehydrogenase (short-subunit alcohol dehydrogenase family)